MARGGFLWIHRCGRVGRVRKPGADYFRCTASLRCRYDTANPKQRSLIRCGKGTIETIRIDRV
jgi:hypothetical protein